MSRPLTPASGWCGGQPGIQFSFIRSGPKRRLSRRERKWLREKTHYRRRRGWSKWPRMAVPTHFYTVNPEAMEFAYLSDRKWHLDSVHHTATVDRSASFRDPPDIVEVL